MHYLSVRTLLYGALALSIAASLLTLAGSTPHAATDSLKTRLEAYWQARVARDMPLALQYEHPRQRKHLGQHISRARLNSGITVTGFSVLDPQALQPDPAAHTARVEMRVEYEYTFPSMSPPMADRTLSTSTVIADDWRKERGVWYHVLQTEVGS